MSDARKTSFVSEQRSSSCSPALKFARRSCPLESVQTGRDGRRQADPPRGVLREAAGARRAGQRGPVGLGGGDRKGRLDCGVGASRPRSVRVPGGKARSRTRMPWSRRRRRFLMKTILPYCSWSTENSGLAHAHHRGRAC